MQGLEEMANIYDQIPKTAMLIFSIGILIFIFYHLLRVWLRLGFGLWRRCVYIIAPSASYSSIEDLISESGMIPRRNIKYIPPDDCDTPEMAKKRLTGKSILIFYYDAPSEPKKEKDNNPESPEHKANREQQCKLLENVRNNKESRAGLIVYARTTMPFPDYVASGDAPNTLVVQATGRLLNDLLNLMMTTSLHRWNPVSAIMKKI